MRRSILAPLPGALPFVTFLLGAAASGLAGQDPDESAPVGWPRELGGDRYSVILYQPEPETFDGNVLTSRAAVQVAERSGATPPVFGVIWFEARMETDRDERTARIVNLSIPEARFPDATQERQQQLADHLVAEITTWDLTMSLDRLLASFEIDEGALGTADINVAAPTVLYVDRPAVLVQIDGEPILQPIEGTEYRVVINTAFTIIETEGAYYLYAAQDAWYRAAAATGPYAAAATVPSGVEGLVPPEADADAPTEPEPGEPGAPPEIVVATEPTELLSIDGDPRFSSIAGTDLLVVENTTSDILLEIGTQQYYILLSGRWYRSASLEGPWTWVAGTDLPETFAAIPVESDMGSIRAHIAGTDEANEAVLDAQVPQTEAIQRTAPSPGVEFDGQPQFQEIEETSVEYAVNTPQQIFKVGDTYYLCEEAVWYVSDAADGPWRVADYVPEEIYDIPASSPAHNVTYVYVYDSTPDVVYVGYTPGYTGTYVYGGTVVYGTGWYYRPWYGTAYYARPYSWGFHVRWNPYTGWNFGLTFSNGWFTFGIGSGWGRPWCCYGGWWGRAGYRHGYYAGRRAGYRAGYAAGYRAANRPQASPYRNNLYRKRDNVARNAARPAQRPSRQPRAADVPNNVFADRNGDVHRRNQNGSWQKRDGNRWGGATNQPSVTPGGQGRPTNRISPSQGSRPVPSTGARPTPGANPSMPSTGNRAMPSPRTRGPSVSGNPGRSSRDVSRSSSNRSRGNARANSYQRSRAGGARAGGRRR